MSDVLVLCYHGVSRNWPAGSSATVLAATSAAGYTTAGALAGRVRDPGALSWPRVGHHHKDVGLRFRAKASPTIRRLRASQLWRIRFMLRRRR